jgi:alpha-galactosidase
MPVTPLDDDGQAWAIDTEQTTYVVTVHSDASTGEARILQRYWGPTLTSAAAAQAAALRASRHIASFSEPFEVQELLPVDGGTRWGPPALQMTFGGRVRSLQLTVRGTEVREDGERLDIHLADDHFPLQVELSLRAVGDSDVVERWTTVRNTAAPDDEVAGMVIARLDSGNWFVPDSAAYRLSTVFGAWAEETQLQRTALPVGEMVLTSRQGITGHHANPWVMIDDGTAGDEQGEVWSVALAWSGSWRITAQHRPEGFTGVAAGFGHDGLAWPLAPGQEVRSPSVLGLYSRAGFGGASRAWHRHVRRHVLPAGGEVRPVLYNSWEATTFNVTEAGQLALARRAAALGVELFVMDDGWFGRRDDDHSSLGDWWPHPRRFPDGLTGLFDGIRELGMAAGLWVEPEMVNPDSDLYRSRPDWVLHLPHRRRDEKRNQLVLNFARDDVAAWALGWLDALVGELGLDYLKWDMNRPFTQAGWPERGAGQDWLWVEHTRSVYAVMEELRRRHPGLRIESCSGGGGRVDLGILQRTDQVWVSDNTDALDRQTYQHGFSQVYPASTMSAWVTDSPNPLTGRAIPLTYRFHVAMAGVLGVGGDLTHWSEEELKEASEHIDRYKSVRPVIQHGAQYRLGGRPGTDPSAVQYVLDDTVVLFVYNPHGNAKRGPRWLRLAGLDPDAVYEVVSGDVADRGHAAAGEAPAWHGSVLMEVGIRPPAWQPIGADYRSDMLILRTRSEA